VKTKIKNHVIIYRMATVYRSNCWMEYSFLM